MKKLVLALALAVLPVSSVFAQLPSQSNPASPSDTSLISPETGVDYTPLQKLLAEQQWREANNKTSALILKASGREAAGWINTESIEQFACWDIATIDKLWKDSSDGHFGLSVQFPIFLSTGNKPGKLDEETYEQFGDRVGWRKDGQWIRFRENLTYNLNAPTGHLPNPGNAYSLSGARLGYTEFFKRAVECKVPGF